MLGLGLGEIVLIGFAILLFVGPEHLPGFLRTAGKLYGQVRRASDDLRRAFFDEADKMDAAERYRALQERRREAEEARRAAMENAAVPQDPVIDPVTAQAVNPTGAPPPGAPKPVAMREDDDPERPAVRVVRPPAPVEAPIRGVSVEEWSKLPEHLKAMLRDAEEKRGPP